MNNYQKKIFIEYFLNSIDKIKINLTNSIKIWELFDLITEEFNLENEVKSCLNQNFSKYKSLDITKFQKFKNLFKDKLKEIANKIDYKNEKSYIVLNKIKEEKQLSKTEYKVLAYYTFCSSNYLFIKLVTILLLPDYSEVNIFYPVLKILNSIGINTTKKLLKLGLIIKNKYNNLFKYEINFNTIKFDNKNYNSAKFSYCYVLK